MPLPTTRYPHPHVGAAGNKGPRRSPCANPQIGCLLWCGQSANRETCLLLFAKLRRANLRGILEEASARSFARQAHGGRARQRPIPPREIAGAAAVQIPSGLDAALPAAVFAATGARRASLEINAATRHPQPVLRHTRRNPCRRRKVSPKVDEAQSYITQTMRHYLRRYV